MIVLNFLYNELVFRKFIILTVGIT